VRGRLDTETSLEEETIFLHKKKKPKPKNVYGLPLTGG